MPDSIAILYTGVLNKLLSDENTNKNQMDSMKVDIKRDQNQFTTKSYLLVFGRYLRYCPLIVCKLEKRFLNVWI